MWRRARAVESIWQVQKLNDVVMNAVKTIAFAPINLHAHSIMAARHFGRDVGRAGDAFNGYANLLAAWLSGSRLLASRTTAEPHGSRCGCWYR